MSIALRRTLSGIVPLVAAGVLTAGTVATATAGTAARATVVPATTDATGGGGGTPTLGQTPDPTWGWD